MGFINPVKKSLDFPPMPQYNVKIGEIQMTAAIHNIIINQGADFSMALKASENGAAKPLAGYSARAQLRPKRNSTALSGEFSCPITNPSEGELTVKMSNSVTKDLTPGIYYYDLELYTLNDGTVIRLLEGKATVTAEVTR